VRDAARAQRFYCGALGFVPVSVWPGYVRVRAPRGSSTIGLHEYERGMKRPPRGAVSHRIYLEVRDLDAFCARLKRRGVAFTQDPTDMPWGWRHAYLEDPDGHEVSLYWAGKKRLRPE
jgi:catechol 2,3-dioxygenase-like lactoylglutathione lyase family enzyme